MTRLSRYPLSEGDVRHWKLREQQPPFKRADLDRFLKQTLQGATTREKREKAVQDGVEKLVEEAKELSGKIQENNYKELQLLKLDSRVNSMYSEIDSGLVPKQARQVRTSGKGKPGPIHGPSKKFLNSIKWFLLEGSFSADQEDLILQVKELRDRRSRLKSEWLGARQKLKVLVSKTISQGIKLPQKIEDLLERESSALDAVFVVHDKESYTSFTLRGKPNLVTSRQGKAIKILHQAHENNPSQPDVSGKAIVELLGSETSDLRDTFRYTQAEELWDTLIVRGDKKGFYRLNI